MPSIGGFEFITLKGEIDLGNGMQVEDVSRPGVNGVAFRLLQRRGEPFRLASTVDVANLAAANTLLLDYKEMQGTLQDVEDEHGTVWSNLMVLSVRTRQRQYTVGKSGGLVVGNTGYLVLADWVLQATEY
jgi:hypothetical protein